MMKSIAARLILAGFLLSEGAAVARTQVSPPPPLSTLPPCPAAKDAKEAKKIAKRKDCDPTFVPAPANTAPDAAAPSASQKFPYPGEAPAKATDTSGNAPAAKAFPYPGEPSPEVPHDPAAAAKAAGTPAGKAFPYPGEHSSDAGSSLEDSTASSHAQDGPNPPAGVSSSSSSAPISSGDDGLTDMQKMPKSTNPDDEDDGQPKLADKGSEGRRNKKTIKPQTDAERVDEDLSVARFYGQSGNLMGAYLRAKDAVKIQPEYPEAHFVLGEAARRLNKRDEAKAELGAYLKLAPDGVHAKAAEKALSEIP